MSDALYRPYEKLVQISIQGKKFKVPENNTCLRAFQFLSPETVAYGRFCWNQECQTCRIVYKMSNEADASGRAVLACKTLVAEGLEITELSEELKWVLTEILKPSGPPAPETTELTRDAQSRLPE
jgi:predicted molibdopterin-dependent oxidoreductase YjgC